jgi:cytoskeletal protein CcmA (bactofilin family)
VTVRNGAEIGGDVTANGTVVIREEAEIGGDVTGATVEVDADAEVDGEVSVTS